ncbi:MAG: hypothetical protein E7568_05580 [Ruminococcaceae bacterium]|nr:hypothetical protein [Oscillospiraceae bacterium]
MQLKNKVQREEFLDNYKKFELFKEIPELELKFYRYVLPNGTQIIVTEYAYMRYENRKSNYVKDYTVKYNLLLSETDNYNGGYLVNVYRHFNPSGNSKSNIIEYLMKTKPEV